jgi:hypothetical protein
MTSTISKADVRRAAPANKETFLGRLLRSDRRRRPATRLEEEEEAVAAISWNAY